MTAEAARLDVFDTDAPKVEPPAPLKTAQLHALLKAKYAGAAYAMLWEVADATGFGKSRNADLVVMDLYPSRGLELHGFELKVSRGDWQRELKDPLKAAAVAQYVDRWWIVAGDKSIVKVDELPAGWGLMVPTKTRDALRVVKPAPRLKPEPLSREFVAAMFRRACEASPYEEVLTQARVEGHAEGMRDAARSHTMRDSTAVREYPQLLATVEAFEKASGIDLANYAAQANPARVGAIVSMLLRTSGTRAAEHEFQLDYAERTLENSLLQLKEARRLISAECAALARDIGTTAEETG